MWSPISLQNPGGSDHCSGLPGDRRPRRPRCRRPADPWPSRRPSARRPARGRPPRAAPGRRPLPPRRAGRSSGAPRRRRADPSSSQQPGPVRKSRDWATPTAASTRSASSSEPSSSRTTAGGVDLLDLDTGPQLHAEAGQPLDDPGPGALAEPRRLGCLLRGHEGGAHPAGSERRRGLAADEARAHHDDRACVRSSAPDQAPGVVEAAQREHARRRVRPRQRDRLRAGGQRPAARTPAPDRLRCARPVGRCPRPRRGCPAGRRRPPGPPRRPGSGCPRPAALRRGPPSTGAVARTAGPGRPRAGPPAPDRRPRRTRPRRAPPPDRCR